MDGVKAGLQLCEFSGEMFFIPSSEGIKLLSKLVKQVSLMPLLYHEFLYRSPHAEVVTLCRPFGGAFLRLLTLCEFHLYLLSSSFFVVIEMEASDHQVLADTLSLSCLGHSLMFQSSLFISFLASVYSLLFCLFSKHFWKKLNIM